MNVKMYERRYWDVSAGKVRAIFDMDKDSQLLNSLPDCDHFMIWLDDQPEELTVNVGASIIRAAKARGPIDPCQHIGVAPAGSNGATDEAKE